MDIEERYQIDEDRLQELSTDDIFIGQRAARELQTRTNVNDEVRSYEVSLWTLQDEFITVLKWSDAQQKNRIQEPKIELDVDGTQKFTFKVPMYIRDHDLTTSIVTYKENPLWYDIKNNHVWLQGLRKVKVIFNKGEQNPPVS